MKRGQSPELVVVQGENLGMPRPTSPDKVLISDLFHAHGRRLVGALTVFTGDVGQAEELAQEAFARVFAAQGRIQDSGRAQSYLYSTAFNLARSGWRRRRNLERVLGRLGTPDVVPAVDVAVLQNSAAAATTAAVKALPARQRGCVVLRYYGELSVAEIAEVLGISSNSVKTHLQRGLASLRTSLGSEDDT